MAELTSKERVQRLFRREPIDRMPVFSGMGMVTIQAIQECGIRFAEVHTSGENLANSAIKTAEMWGLDCAIIPYDMCTVAEALGRGTSLYADSEDILYPTVPTKWPTMEEVQIPDDFLTRKRMPEVDKGFEMLKSKGDLAIGAWVLGPFTQAGQVFELDVLLKGIKKQKEAIEAFLGKMTDLTIKLAKHYESQGADYLTVREMGSGTDLLSPRMWKTLIQPNLTKVIESVSIPVVNHICGGTDLIVAMMNECGAEAISVDHKNNMVESRKKIGDEVLLFGNFNPYDTLVQGEPDAVDGIIKQCVDDGVDAVWPGCDIWPDVNPAAMENYVKAVKAYGVAATPAVGRL
jgi:[methyl-Co(III) methanol-specific corrinoid protein]:coenzyme M methyltransferase